MEPIVTKADRDPGKAKTMPAWKVWVCYASAGLFTVLIFATLIGAVSALLPESWGNAGTIWRLFEYAGLSFLFIFFTRYFGDLNSNNVIITDDGKLCIIDFADAVLAPKVYEDAYIAAELFKFDSVLLRGYFSDYSEEELVGIITDGLLIHDFGGDVVRKYLGKPEEFHCINDLRKRIYEKLTNEPSGQ